MSNIKWYVGQPIVCIQTHTTRRIMKNDEFIIKGIKQTCCGIVIDVGKKALFNRDMCRVCRNKTVNTDGIHWFGENLFAPLDVNLSELTEVLTKEIQEKH